MKKLFTKIKKIIPTKRKLVQLYFALLFNANAKGFISGNIYQGTTKQVCVPGINCYSCPGAVGACPIGSLQGSFSADKSTLFYVGGILLLYSILFGRFICGWLCPFGFIQELLHKIKTPKIKKSRVTRLLSFFKYVVLVFFVFIVPIMYAFRDTPLPAFCKYICPAGTLEGGVVLVMLNSALRETLGFLYAWKMVILAVTVLLSVIIYRPFCKYICPLGAIYSFFNKISLFKINLDKEKCVSCNACVQKCRMNVNPSLAPDSAECIRCRECISVCPTGALRDNFSCLSRADKKGTGEKEG